MHNIVQPVDNSGMVGSKLLLAFSCLVYAAAVQTLELFIVPRCMLLHRMRH